VVDASLGSVFAYRSLTEVRQFAGEEAVSDEEILPGFSLLLAEVFRE
jgi:hypothetical protein